MFKIIRQGHVYSPEDQGVQDLLVCQGGIVRIEKDLSHLADSLKAEIIPAKGKMVIPGLIDQHVHFLGGGDYEGPTGMTTDLEFSSLIRGGITTAVGLLGCDISARNLVDLVRRSQAFEQLGITTYVYAGALNNPTPTLTGSVLRDVMVVEKMLGVKIRVADFRAYMNSSMELVNLAKEALAGAQHSGKKGVIHVHVGRAPERMEQLFEVIKLSYVPISHFIPTHVNRLAPNVVEHAIQFAKMGGTVDMSAIMSPEGGSPTSIRADHALSEMLKAGVPVEQVTLSSDGNCPMPIFDDAGKQTGLYNFKPEYLYNTFQLIVKNCGLSFSDALKVVTSNVAQALGIQATKGSIGVGKDADLLILSKDYKIEAALARGRLMMQEGRVLARGNYEK